MVLIRLSCAAGEPGIVMYACTAAVIAVRSLVVGCRAAAGETRTAATASTSASLTTTTATLALLLLDQHGQHLVRLVRHHEAGALDREVFARLLEGIREPGTTRRCAQRDAGDAACTVRLVET